MAKMKISHFSHSRAMHLLCLLLRLLYNKEVSDQKDPAQKIIPKVKCSCKDPGHNPQSLQLHRLMSQHTLPHHSSTSCIVLAFSARYPSTIRYLPSPISNTSSDSRMLSSSTPSRSTPSSSKNSHTSLTESTTTAIQSSRNASASSGVSATGSG